MLGHYALGQFALGEVPRFARSVLADAGVFTVSGQPVGNNFSLTAGSGSFSVSGQAANGGFSMPAGRGGFTLTGRDARLLRSLRVEAESVSRARGGGHFLFGALGQFALGQATSPSTAATTFVLEGQAVELVRRPGVLAEAGSFLVSGQDVSFIVQAYPSKIRLFPRVGRAMRARTGGGGVSINSTPGSTVRARAFGG